MGRRLLAGLPLLAAAFVVGLYGLFALLYRDHSGGSTYVTFFGRELDAHLVGGIALGISSLLVALSARLLRRRRR